MTARGRFPIFAVAFAAVYPAVYYLAVHYNWALFAYGPAVGEWLPLNHAASDGPTMFWYGWIATSAIAGTLAGLIACMVPGKGRWLWSGFAWLVPICAIAAIAHLLSGYFLR